MLHVRADHALYAGVPFANYLGHQYQGHVSEYDSGRYGGEKLHLVLLSEISDIAHEGSILYGELALLLTAMRNRAYQPAVFNHPDSDEEPEEEDHPLDQGFLFEDERRFPVIMVSIVGVQHARISYACMNGLEVVIRQSQLWSMKEKDEDLLNFLSSVLLSIPLDEDPVAELAQQTDTMSMFQDRDSNADHLLFANPMVKIPGATAASGSNKGNCESTQVNF